MVTPKSAAERKRAHRENMVKNGFIRVECWAHKEDVSKLKALEMELKTKRLEENKMSLQSQLNNQAISMLPMISAAISKAKDFEANQMKNKALQEIGNSKPSISEMSKEQLQTFQAKLIGVFKHNEWM